MATYNLPIYQENQLLNILKYYPVENLVNPKDIADNKQVFRCQFIFGVCQHPIYFIIYLSIRRYRAFGNLKADGGRAFYVLRLTELLFLSLLLVTCQNFRNQTGHFAVLKQLLSDFLLFFSITVEKCPPSGIELCC